MSDYLSIDLDYWCDHESQNSATNFFKKVLDLQVPITFVIEHEELVKDINKMKHLTRMYNVDYHSDIIAQHDQEDTPQDYEWANHAKGRTRAEYNWIMPYTKCYADKLGTCHGDDENPFLKYVNCGWKSISKRTGLRYVNLENIERVGVCLSPCFTILYPVENVLSMLDFSYYKATHLCQNQPWSSKRRKRGILTKISA